MTRTPSPGSAVRVTLHPGEDVLLRPGTRLGELRAPLAALTRRPELRHAPLLAAGEPAGGTDGAAGGEPLADDQVVGEHPLLPGAVLGVPATASGADPVSFAHQPWLLARVAGRAAGSVVGADGPWSALRSWARLRRDGPLAVRRAAGPAAWLAPRPEPAPGAAPWALALLPAVASLGLATTLRQPLLAVFALVGLVVAVPHLRATRQRGTAGPAPLPGPARLLTYAHAARHVSPGAWAVARAAWAAAPRATAEPVGPFGVPPGPGAHLLRAPDGDPWEQLLHDGAVAVLGPADDARAVARALVARLAVRGAHVLPRAPAPGWSWVRWLPPGGPRVLVVDTCAGLPADGGVGHGNPATYAADLVVSVGTAPAGCRAVVRVLSRGRVLISGPDGARRVVPLVGVTAEWAEQLGRLLAGAAWLGRAATGGQEAGLPDVVPLTTVHGLPAVPGPGELGARWARATGWAVPLGTGADGAPVPLDLVRDGPHLLVAGTTGSGKSELLQTLVLGLALTRSPADLALVLVDFKGGASLGACGGLPHVVGQVTDLEPGLAARALAGLRAELRRREQILATHGVPDVTALPHGTLHRLVVVIDEFRALADDLPEFLPALLRVAAQGRSLGVHLVLATQRPGGAVGPDLRANVSARIALRVTDPLESRDVLDDPAAARIPASAPGRAMLRLGSAPAVPLQCAQAGAPPTAEAPLARRAPSGPRAGAALATDVPTERAAVPDVQGPATGRPDTAALLVDAARGAARALGHVPGPPPWLPPLPRRASVADLPPAARRDRAGLLLALGDDPDRQRRTTVCWHPAQGHLAILGPARSGRTTALVTVALAALGRGWSVHGVARDPDGLAGLRQHPGYAGTVHPDDAGSLARLPERTLVLVDGAEDVRGVLPATALRSGAAFALAADGPSVGGLASRVGPRLVLLGTDRAADVVLGAPARLAGTGGPPGRAAWCGRGEAVLCQVLEPGVSPRSRSSTSPRRRRES